MEHVLLPLLPLDLRNNIPRGNTSVVGRSAVIRENWSNGEHSSPAGEANNSAICGGREGETAGKEGKFASLDEKTAVSKRWRERNVETVVAK